MDTSYQRYLAGNLIGPTIGHMILSKNTVYSQLCPDCEHEACSSGRGTLDKKIKDLDYSDPLISYKINNYGYRSDDITEEDATSNFLFSGCSNTLGIGVPVESIWAHQLNSLLNGNKFINLGINSGSYKTIVYDVFNYIRNFGKPKGVFLLFPNIERQIMFTGPIKEESYIHVKVYRKPKEEYDKISKVIQEQTNVFEFYNTVKMLEDYLFSLDIPFVWGTWDFALEKKIMETEGFKNFIPLENNFEVYNKIESSDKPKKLDNDYWDIARDLSHLGSKYHLYYATIFYDEWLRKYKDKTSIESQ